MKVLEKERKSLIFSKNSCYLCGKEGELKYNLCPDCMEFLDEFRELKNLHLNYLDEVFVAFEYKGVVKDMIISFKFKDDLYLKKGFGEILSEIILKNNLQEGVLAFVPMERGEYNKRGYNQCEILAKEVSKSTGMEVTKLLKKIKKTKRQVGLGYEERQENLRGAYEFKGDLTGRDVVLIDDILTTGATGDECAKTLKEKGASKVSLIVLASLAFY